MNLQSPVKAIRAKCLECSNDNVVEVKECPITDCALYPFRFGKNPFANRPPMSEEQKEKMKAARMAKVASEAFTGKEKSD